MYWGVKGTDHKKVVVDPEKRFAFLPGSVGCLTNVPKFLRWSNMHDFKIFNANLNPS